jgi:uncharacterized membrane protein
MEFLMSNLTFISILLALGIVIYFTVVYARDLRTGRDSFARKTARWLKNVIDSLFGAG